MAEKNINETITKDTNTTEEIIMENNTKNIIDVEAREIETEKNDERKTENGVTAITDTYILGLDWSDIGPCVISCANGENAAMAKKAATICRRRFRPNEVVIISILDEDKEGESGLAFTTKGIYYWAEDDTFVDEVKYADIEEVDYDSNSVKYRKKYRNEISDGDKGDKLDEAVNEVRKRGRHFIESISYSVGVEDVMKFATRNAHKYLPCVGIDSSLDEEETCEYARGLYNFIADIVDVCSES